MTEVAPIRTTCFLVAACLLLCGCYSPHSTIDTSRRFQEGASADVVILFYRWDNFFITRPEYRENGFRKVLKREELKSALDTLRVRRGMAVILLGWNYDSRDIHDIFGNWKSILAECGFRRVVCLYGDDENKLDGLPIIDEWKQPVEQTKQITGF